MKVKKYFNLEFTSLTIGLILLFAGLLYPCPSFALRLRIGASDTYARMIDEQVLIEEQQLLALYKEKNNADHVRRVARIAVLMAKEMMLNEASIEKLRRASLLHDIGYNGLDNDAVRAIGRLGKKHKINTRRKGAATSNDVIERVEKEINHKLLKGEMQEDEIKDLVIRISDSEVKLQEHIRDNLCILLDHADRGVEVIRGLEERVNFSVTDDILTIVKYHSYPNKLPLNTDEEIRSLVGILMASDNLETLNNKAKFEATSSEEWEKRGISLFNDAEHYGALPRMKRQVERGRILEEPYLLIERLIYERNPELIRLILEARETNNLLPEEIEHIENAMRRRDPY